VAKVSPGKLKARPVAEWAKVSPGKLKARSEGGVANGESWQACLWRSGQR
jgi:hypothetical protein